MELIILGSGTGIPLNYRASPSLALRVGAELILFDMGPGTLRQLGRAGLSHELISRIFFTHFHPDHTLDLVHFLFATRNPNILGRRRPFSITGPVGLREFIHHLRRAYPGWISLPSEIMEIQELDINQTVPRDYSNLRILVRPTKHTPESLAYRVESRRGKSLVYSGDTVCCQEIVELATGTDLLILESSFPDGEEVEGHLTPSQAGHLASMAGVNRLVLTHFYPECLGTDIAAQCRKTYKGELILARDLLHIRI
ncbi:MAG: MBL fold metallo-hydrolase [Pseudomonadota bacterium]